MYTPHSTHLNHYNQTTHVCLLLLQRLVREVGGKGLETEIRRFDGIGESLMGLVRIACTMCTVKHYHPNISFQQNKKK